MQTKGWTENSFGLNIKLPMEQLANLFFANDPHLLEFKFFLSRKIVFIKEFSATVLLSGEFSTLNEGFENLTLFQTGKSMPRPIIFLDHKGDNYWDRWMGFITLMMVEETPQQK
jgi:predicted Rossmann-fold nucleotide-binding protein